MVADEWVERSNRRRERGNTGKESEGSPNYFVDLPASVAVSDIARLAIAALVHVWGIPN